MSGIEFASLQNFKRGILRNREPNSGEKAMPEQQFQRRTTEL